MKQVIKKLNQLDYEINLLKPCEKDMLVGVTNRLEELRQAINGYFNRYRKEGTYLVREKGVDNSYMRWGSDKTLFFAGSEDDALFGLNEPNNYEAIRVCDADEVIQKEYENRIDKCIESGEIEL